MKSTGLIALLVVTAAAVVVAALGSSGGGGRSAEPRLDRPVLPALPEHLGEVSHVSLVHGEEKTTLVHQGDAWVIEEKSDYPADAAKVSATLRNLADLRYVEAKTEKKELYPRLEVEDAGKADSKSTLVTLSDAKGTPLGAVIAGKRSIDQFGGGTDGVYVRSPGDPQSWLARGTLDLPADTTGWLNRDIVDVPRDSVREVKLMQPDGSTLDIAHEKPTDPLALKGVPPETKPKSDTALVDATTALASLTLSDVRPAAEMPPDNVTHAEISNFSGLTLTLALADKDGKSWVHLVANGTGDAAKTAETLNAKLAPWAYAIPEYKAKILRTKLADVVAAPKPS